MPSWPAAQQAPSMAQPNTPASYAYPASQSTLPIQTVKTDKLTALSDPAFIPVAVRQGFGQYGAPAIPYAGYVPPPPLVHPQMTPPSPVNGSPPAADQAKGKIEWPPSVRNYVQRSFLPQNDDPSVSRADIEAMLKNTIGSAKENGTLHTIDWDKMPLPQALVKAGRGDELKRNVNASSPSRFHATLNPKKRKSADFASDNTSQPPWRSTNTQSSLESRITYPSPEKRPSIEEPLPKSSKFQKQVDKRKRRFDNEYKALRSPSPPPPSAGPIVGTCETLEKKYLRLTAPPVPSKVRPESILRQTLDLLKKKWKRENNYSYICDQFKSMRQDLTVQRIKNDFTVSVYEIHARIALEKGDIGEYNQCQTQLRFLYTLGLKGNPIEFKAYRILYFIHTANRMGLNDTLADLTAAEKEEKPIKHALEVRSSLALGNYHKFFQLYLDTPNMGAYVMDMFVVRERLAALCNICKA